MPGSEFRLLPRLPLEYKTYKLISPGKLGQAMTKGWVPVASVNYTEVRGEIGVPATRFLIGKGMKTGVQAAPGAGPTPVLMFSQPGAAGEDEEPANTTQVQQLLDRMAGMSKAEILALHEELQQQQTFEAEDEEAEDDEGDFETAEVRDAMDELLADDDGTEDDDE